jgi:Protein of unknown function (DUF3467)
MSNPSENSHEGQAEQVAQAQQFQTVRAPEFERRYANSINIAVTLSDVCLIFGTIGESPNNDPRPAIMNHTAMFLSPQQAKLLVGVLAGNVQAYERQFGPISVGQQSVIQPAGALPRGKM